jgi:hypothetical protein
MTSSFEHFFWQQRELQRVLEGMRPTLDALDRIPRSIIDSIAKLDLLRDQFMLPPEYLASTRKIQEVLALRPAIESFELLSGLNSPTIRAFQQQQSQIDEILKAIETPTIEINAAMQRMINSVTSTEALLGLQCISGPLVEVALQPQLAFQEFAKKHLDLAAVGSEIARQNRLLLVDASVDLLDSIKKGFELAALMRPIHEDLWIGARPDVNVYSALDQEFDLLDLEGPVIDAESAVEESGAGMIAALGAQLVQLVYDLNLEAEREGEVPVFKPTTKALMACAVIPSRVAYNTATFNEVTDHLFFLLYEGSGSAQRLTTKLDERKLDALWMLKHLRLGSRHDIDHGTEWETEKKNRQVGEAYKRLVGSVAPRSRKEWMSAQVALYKELVKMLEQVGFGEGD